MTNTFAGDYSLTSVLLSVSDTEFFDIKELVQEFNLYESISSVAISADLVISDNKNIIEKLKGLETINIKVSTKGINYNLNFLIYKIDSRTLEEKSQIYIIRLCTNDTIQNEYSRFSIKFKNLKISEIVRNIIKQKFRTDKVTIDDSLYNISFINPNWRVYDTISWLSKRTISKDYPLSCGYLFYENLNGYNFRSIDSLLSQDINSKYTFTYTQAKTNEPDIENKKWRIIKYNSTDYFDILENMRYGLYSHYNMQLDFTNRNKVITKSTLDGYWNATKHLGTNIPYPNSVHFNPTRVFVRPVVNDLYEEVTDKINTNFDRAIYRYKLLQYIQISIQIMGNMDLRVGELCRVSIPSPNPTESTRQRQQDKRLSGVYMIHSIRTTINRTKSYTIINLCKDSFVDQVSQVNTKEPLNIQTVSFNVNTGI